MCWLFKCTPFRFLISDNSFIKMGIMLLQYWSCKHIKVSNSKSRLFEWSVSFEAQRARVSRIIISHFHGGRQPRKSSWSIESTCCSTSYYNLVEIEPCVLMQSVILSELQPVHICIRVVSSSGKLTPCTTHTTTASRAPRREKLYAWHKCTIFHLR